MKYYKFRSGYVSPTMLYISAILTALGVVICAYGFDGLVDYQLIILWVTPSMPLWSAWCLTIIGFIVFLSGVELSSYIFIPEKELKGVSQ